MSRHVFYTNHTVRYMFSLTREEVEHIKDKEYFQDIVKRPDGSFFVKYFDAFEGEFKYDTMLDFVSKFDEDLKKYYEYHKNNFITLMKTRYAVNPTNIEYFTKNYEMKQMKGFLS